MIRRVSIYHIQHDVQKKVEILSTYVYKVHEVSILAVDHLAEVLIARYSHLTLAIWHNNRPVVLIEEYFPTRRPR